MSEMLIGLCLAGLAAFAAFAALFAVSWLLEMASGRSDRELGGLVFTLACFTVLGPAIAQLLCVAIGLPAWRVAQEKGLSTFLDAAVVGASVGAAFAIGWRVIWVWDEWSRRGHGGAGSAFSWGTATQLDHLPTPFGWLLFVADVIKLMLVGALTGVSARAIAAWRRRRRTPDQLA